MTTFRTMGLALLLIVAPSVDAQEAPLLKHSALALHDPREDVDPDRLGVYTAYEEAQRLEQEISRMYSEIRATNLSQVQRQMLERSLRNTKSPVSQRATVSVDILEGQAQDAEDVTVYQNELKVVMRESDAIVANAQEMLRSLLPEPEEETPEEMEMMILEAPAQTRPASDQPRQTPQERREARIETLVQEADERIEEARDALEEALEDLERAQEFIEKKKEEVEREIEEQDEQNEEEDKEKQEERERLEELDEIIDEAEVAVEEAIDAIEDDAEDMEEKIDNAREVIKELKEALEETEEAEEELEASEEEPAEAEAEEAIANLEEAQESMEAAAARLEAAREMAAQNLSTNPDVAQTQALEALARAESGRYLDISQQMRNRRLEQAPEPVTDPRLRPPDIRVHYKGARGSKIVAAGGRGAVWFYLDDWYIIGPYDNRGRQNIEAVFPPQSLIDLDATYFGKDEQQIKWRYDSFNYPMIWPRIVPAAPSFATKQDLLNYTAEYAIFYGYTELWCHETMDLWIAVGSDDRSDVWINDMPVWHSSNVLKAWNMGEGYRKVHFKQGHNKILFRLENGWRELGMSVMVCTHDPR